MNPRRNTDQPHHDEGTDRPDAGRGGHGGEHDRAPCFWLDATRLATNAIASEDELPGIYEEHEGGLAAAIAGRFRQAEDAGAICGPPDLEAVVYAIHGDGLIVAVRERLASAAAAGPLRQVASYSLDAGDVACPLDHSFEECCAAIVRLLEEANGLLPGLAGLRAAEAGRDRGER